MATTSKTLQILLTLKDKASKELSAFQGKVKGMKPTFQKMSLIGTAAFAGIGAGVYKSTQDASKAQEIFNKFDVVFGDVSDGANTMAKDLRDNYGLAESTAKDLMSATGDMLTGFGMGGDKALDLAGKTNKLAVDLASFTNIEGGAERASAALTKALLGERESVKELGIAILEEDVKAKVKAMEAGGKFTDETERQKKAYATLEIAMEQSKNAVGDYERTQDSLANQQRLLKERTKELSESFGTAFMPILQSIVEKVIPIVNKIAEWAKENPKLVKTIVIVVGVLTGLLAVIGLIGLALPAIITGFTLLTGPIGLVIAAIIAVIAFGVMLVKHWDDIKATGILLWETLKDAWNNAIDWIAEIVGQFAEYVFGRYEKMFTNISNVVKKIRDFFIDIWKIMWGTIETITGGAIDWIGDKITAVITFFENLIKKVGEAVSKIADFTSKIGGGWSNAVSNIKWALGLESLQSGGMVNAPLGSAVPILAHGGERIVPAGRMAGAGAGGGTVVNINGGTYLSEDVALEIGNMIVDRLKLQIRV